MHTRAARDLVLRRPRLLDEVLLGVFALVQHAVFVDRTLLVGLSARVAGNYSKFFELARNWLRWGLRDCFRYRDKLSNPNGKKR